MRWWQNYAMVAQKRRLEGLHDHGSNMNRKFKIALALYVVLALLSWFTLEGRIFLMGRPVELRLVPLVIIGGLALRTVLAMQAEKIRRSGEKGGS
jgi:hypothetical protein